MGTPGNGTDGAAGGGASGTAGGNSTAGNAGNSGLLFRIWDNGTTTT